MYLILDETRRNYAWKSHVPHKFYHKKKGQTSFTGQLGRELQLNRTTAQSTEQDSSESVDGNIGTARLAQVPRSASVIYDKLPRNPSKRTGCSKRDGIYYYRPKTETFTALNVPSQRPFVLLVKVRLCQVVMRQELDCSTMQQRKGVENVDWIACWEDALSRNFDSVWKIVLEKKL